MGLAWWILAVRDAFLPASRRARSLVLELERGCVHWAQLLPTGKQVVQLLKQYNGVRFSTCTGPSDDYKAHLNLTKAVSPDGRSFFDIALVIHIVGHGLGRTCTTTWWFSFSSPQLEQNIEKTLCSRTKCKFKVKTGKDQTVDMINFKKWGKRASMRALFERTSAQNGGVRNGSWKHAQTRRKTPSPALSR